MGDEDDPDVLASRISAFAPAGPKATASARSAGSMTKALFNLPIMSIMLLSLAVGCRSAGPARHVRLARIWM